MADDEGDGDGEPDDPIPSGRLDVSTLRAVARSAATHPLVDDWAFDPSALSPRALSLHLDASAYPIEVTAARIDVRWFDTGDYSLHYLETREGSADPYQCRWDRHPKTAAPRTHFHPPPSAGDAEPSPLDPHHLDVLFAVLDRVGDRIRRLHDGDV